MDNRNIKKWLGLFLVVVAVFGMLLVVFGLVVTWRFQAAIAARVDQALTLTGSTLDTTANGLNIVANSLENTAGSLGTLQDTSGQLVKAIDETTALLDNSAVVIGQDVPATIQAVQQSLVTAQEGAAVIDDVLGILSRIPFISDITYNPETPLDQSIGEIAAELDGIPGSLGDIGDQLQSTGETIAGFQGNIDQLTNQLGEIEASMGSMQGVIEEYQSLLEDAGTQVESLQEDVAGFIQAAAWVLTIVLIWFGFAQVGPLLQGWQIYQNNRSIPPADVLGLPELTTSA